MIGICMDQTLSCLILSLRVVLINSQRALDVQGRHVERDFLQMTMSWPF